MAHAVQHGRTRLAGLSLALALAGAAPLAAQVTAPPAPPAQEPLSFRAAMELATTTNLELAARSTLLGLSVSTVITLVFVPTALALVGTRRR